MKIRLVELKKSEQKNNIIEIKATLRNNQKQKEKKNVAKKKEKGMKKSYKTKQKRLTI